MVATLSPRNLGMAIELESLPERIRGFGHVKERNIAAVAVDREKLLQQYRHGGGMGLAA